jgi:predicted deacylase
MAPVAPAATSAPVLEVLPRDLSAYKQGNTGIDYVHRFESGKPGPHVLINALTHGNEFCGMVAATHLLDSGLRPRIGTLTVSFANVEAYESFDAAKPFESRQLVHNFNRIWSAQWLDGSEDSPELRRARLMRPVVAAADHILDIHSTSQDVVPFWVYKPFERNAQVALAIGRPAVHMVMPGGMTSGAPLMEHGEHGLSPEQGSRKGAAMVVECGQHFRKATADLAVAVTLDFLAHFGLLESQNAPASQIRERPPQKRLELLSTHVIKTTEFAHVWPLVGFEVFAKGELIATDGAEEIRAPCDNCTVMMPARTAVIGREGLYLTRPV